MRRVLDLFKRKKTSSKRECEKIFQTFVTEEGKTLQEILAECACRLVIEEKDHISKYPFDRRSEDAEEAHVRRADDGKTGFKCYVGRLEWIDAERAGEVYLLRKSLENSRDREDAYVLKVQAFKQEDVEKVVLQKLSGCKVCRFKQQKFDKPGFHMFSQREYNEQFEVVLQVPEFKTLSELKLKMAVRG